MSDNQKNIEPEKVYLSPIDGNDFFTHALSRHNKTVAANKKIELLFYKKEYKDKVVFYYSLTEGSSEKPIFLVKVSFENGRDEKRKQKHTYGVFLSCFIQNSIRKMISND